MDLFEYLVVMVSIVLGLSVTQVLRGLGKVVRNQSRFPPIIIWAIVLFYIHIQVWWGLWDLSNITSWNMFSFYLLIAIPCSMFAAVELLLPLSSDANTDWEAHFFQVRNWFFGAVCLFSIIAAMTTYFLNNVPLTHPYRIIQVTVTATAIAGFFTRSTRAHTWISSIYLAVLVIGQTLFRLNPGLSA